MTSRIYCAVFGCMNSLITHPEITFFRLPGNSERDNLDRVSFAGGIIKTMAKTVKLTNIFDSQNETDLVTDETLRKYRMAEEVYRRGREKKVSIAEPDAISETHKEIFRRQTGFVRPEDLARMRQFERPEEDDDDRSGETELDDYLPYTRQVSVLPPPIVISHKTKGGYLHLDSKERTGSGDEAIEERESSDHYGSRFDTSALVPKLLVDEDIKKTRESPGGVGWKSGSNFRATRISDFSPEKRLSDNADGKRKMSVLTRLMDDVTQGPGPTLKDYKPLSERQENKSLFLLTYSPEKRLNLLKDDPRELYIMRREQLEKGNKSIDHILGLQHGKVYRRISTDYVRIIDQIEKKEDTSIRGLEYAKYRPSISVKEYRKQNKEYNDRLAKSSKLSKDSVVKTQEKDNWFSD